MDFVGIELRDHPGCLKIDLSVEGETERSWSFVRKPDGTYWAGTVLDLFPRSGAREMQVDFGEQILNPKALARCEEYYSQWKQKTARSEISKIG